jgi:predicted O-methyltransferase YrrM
MDYRDVQGFMPPAGLEVLRGLAAGKRVLEIGCWKARTAIAMAEVAARVWSIDHFQGDRYAGAARTLPEAWHNILASGLPIRLLVGPFAELLLGLDLSQFDLVFYDGDHDGEPTRQFLQFALAGCRPGTTIVLDDYSAVYPQVREAVAAVVPAAWPMEVVGALAIFTIPCESSA